MLEGMIKAREPQRLQHLAGDRAPVGDRSGDVYLHGRGLEVCCDARHDTADTLKIAVSSLVCTPVARAIASAAKPRSSSWYSVQDDATPS